MNLSFSVSDEMRRETAIAEDYWHDVFKQNRKDSIETTLQNLEQKIDLLQEKQKPTTVKSLRSTFYCYFFFLYNR